MCECVWPSRGDRARTLDQVQKALTAAGLIFVCVCVCVVSLTLLSVIFASQPANILFLPSSLPFLPSPLCRSFVLLFFARHYFYFNVVCFSQFSSVQLGLVRCSLARKSSRPLGSRAVFALTLSDIAVQLSIFGVSVFQLISLPFLSGLFHSAWFCACCSFTLIKASGVKCS